MSEKANWKHRESRVLLEIAASTIYGKIIHPSSSSLACEMNTNRFHEQLLFYIILQSSEALTNVTFITRTQSISCLPLSSSTPSIPGETALKTPRTGSLLEAETKTHLYSEG